MSDAFSVNDFISKWRAVELKERSAAQEHFLDLCRLLGEPSPAQADPTGDFYCFDPHSSDETVILAARDAIVG
jgi:hypothetical protein